MSFAAYARKQGIKLVNTRVIKAQVTFSKSKKDKEHLTFNDSFVFQSLIGIKTSVRLQIKFKNDHFRNVKQETLRRIHTYLIHMGSICTYNWL